MDERRAAWLVGTTSLTELNYDVYYMDCSGGSATLTLPADTTFNGRRIQVKKSAGGALNVLTIQPASGLIDGLSSLTLLLGTTATFHRGPTDAAGTPANYTWHRIQ